MKQRKTRRQNVLQTGLWRNPDNGRLLDWHNLQKPRWRDALRALAAPATRVHRYRNLRASLFEDVTDRADERDCP